MDLKTEPRTMARKAELIAKRDELTAQLAVVEDQAAQNMLRADYRAVINELDGFYDDIREGQPNEL